MKSALLIVALLLGNSGVNAAVLYGRVLGAKSHLVAGATVSLGKSSTAMTDVQGKYRFANLAEGTYSVREELALRPPDLFRYPQTRTKF